MASEARHEPSSNGEDERRETETCGKTKGKEGRLKRAEEKTSRRR